MKIQTAMTPQAPLEAKLNEIIEGMGLPLLVKEGRECTECGKKIGVRNVRGFGLRLNAQHIGDLVLEIHCPHCNAGYDLHYRKSCWSYSEFIRALEEGLDIEPVPAHRIAIHDNTLFEIAKQEEKENEPN